MILKSPKRKTANSIKKIGEGHGNQKVVRSLNKTLLEHPELMEGAVYHLLEIIQKNKVDTFTYIIEVMLNIAEIKPHLLSNSSDAIIKTLEFPEDSLDMNYTVKSLDILGMIASRYPENMQSSIRIVIQKMNSPNSQVRSASFFILDLIAKTHPKYFSNYTLDLFRSFHSPYNDERLYATRLIVNTSTVSHNSFDVFCEMIQNLVHNCSDITVMQEAYDAITETKLDENTLDFTKDVPLLTTVKSESEDYGELADSLAESIKGIDFEESAIELLKSLGMEHLIVNPPKKKD